MKSKRLYGGFVENKLDLIECDTGWGGYGRAGLANYPMMPAVFKTRQAARQRYQDVRPVEIREVRILK